MHIGCVFKIEKCFSRKQKFFLKGCKWSPDGLCILSASDDNQIRLFEADINNVGESVKDCDPILTYNEGGTVYDYTWYPHMSSSDPVSCVFASCSRDAPVHLWDAFTGELRATYQPINQFDEVHPSYSLCFSPEGKLYCGYKKQMKVFDLCSPGRFSEMRCVKEHQSGIVSSIAVNPAMPSIYALGCYDKSVGIYTEPQGELLCLMKAHVGGVTQILYSPDGHYLYSGARMDDNILCWDLRKPGEILFTATRTVKTSQRIYFDLLKSGQYLITGSTDGLVSVFDSSRAPEETGMLNCELSWQAHQDCANGVSAHPSANAIATASGQRHICLDSSDDESDTSINPENNLKIWKTSWS